MAAYVVVKKKADGIELLRLLAPKMGEKVLNAVRRTGFGEAILTRREVDGSEVTLTDDDLLAAGVYYIEAGSPGIAASPANIDALLKLLASAPQQFSQYTQDQRSASRSQISLPAEDVAELKIWMHEVENNNNVRKATKSLSDMLNTAERAGTVAVRYWRFRTGAATGVQLSDLVDIMVAAHKDPKLERPKEILFHRGLLAYFQAAALGQPDVRFEVEDFSRENKSREDVRTFATIRRPPFAVERPCHPNENKRTWHRANAQDPTGISQNKEALSKLWKCIRVHMADEVDEQPSIVGTISSRIELLFFAEFEFRTLPDGSRTLAAVYLAPAPPSYRPPAGGDCLWLVPDLDAKLLSLERLKKDERTLAAILPLRPPEGFTAGVRYVDHIAQKHNIQVATLQLRPGAFCIAEDNGFAFSSQPEPVDLDESDAYHGPNSVVLHPWGANFVVKIADFEKIKKEVEMHRLIDKSSCPHLRKALLDMSGMIEGAGPGLAGIVLCGHLYRSINSTDCTAENGSLGAYYFVQVEAALVALHEVPVIHRDIKPSNILLSPGNTPRERIAILNDYGESCREDEFVRGGYGRLLYTSPSVDEGGFSTRDDDYFALGLTFAHLNNLQVDDPYSSSGKLELINKLCGLNEVYEKCLGKFLHVLKVTG